MEDSNQKQIALIEQMIANAKGNISNGSIFYLLWGWLVFFAALINYVLLVYVEYKNHWIAWPVLMILGGILSMIIGYRKSKQQKIKTYAERALNFVWLGFVITLLLVLFTMSHLGVQKTYPIIIFLYGLGTFTSGGILKFKPLLIGGVLCWLLGILAVYSVFENQLIIIALAILVSYLIPGYMLRKAEKNV